MRTSVILGIVIASTLFAGMIVIDFASANHPQQAGWRLTQFLQTLGDHIDNLQAQVDGNDVELADHETRIATIEGTFLNPQSNCSGSAACIPGYITANIDGDTIELYGKSIRFALVDAPESGEIGFQEASDFIANACPVGALSVADEDDMQTGGSFGRIIGVVHCNGMNLNEAILDEGLAVLATGFCGSSEFASSTWAQNHGCP